MEAPTNRLFALGTVDLRGTDGQVVGSVLAQPKRLALLAYLAIASPRGLHRRDRLVALFWPEFEQDQARHALRLALHHLRRALGPDTIENVGDDTIRLHTSMVWCDVNAFEQALDVNDTAGALALYRGDLLDGLYLSERGPSFEQWLEGERDRLRRRAAQAAGSLATTHQNEGDTTGAISWARQVSTFLPDDEPSLRKLLTLLDEHGDRAGALRAYDEFSRRMAQEFEIAPSAETRALVDAIRSRATPKVARARVEHAEAREPESPTVVAPAALPTRRRRSLVPFLAVGAVVLLTAVAVARRTHAAPRPTIAVGGIVDRTGGDSTVPATLRSLLATDLARVPNVSVISHARIHEILGQLGVRADTGERIADAARYAGASELIEGELYRVAGDSFRLDLRREDLVRHVVHGAVSVEARDLFALVESATHAFAESLDLPPPSSPVTDVTTSSLVAQRFYEEGLRAYYRSDEPLALKMFEAALAEDSTFAMAAYYAAVSSAAAEPSKRSMLMAQAVRMSKRAGERDRLVIAQWAARAANSPAMLPLAESLATRFPTEPDGELALGNALTWTNGMFLEAIPHFRIAVARDSLSLRVDNRKNHAARPCRACEALGAIIFAFSSVDSSSAAIREARAWIALQPRSETGHDVLAQMLERVGNYDEAIEHYRIAENLRGDVGRGMFGRALVDVRAGRFDSGDQMLRELIAAGDYTTRREALWWLTISLRMQGRLTEALNIATQYRRTIELATEDALERRMVTIPEAQVLFESGRPLDAAALFEAIAAPQPSPADSAPGVVARFRAWYLTHAATAYAAAGDTARVAALADTIRALGQKSAFVRDRRLHHYLLGLLWMARGNPKEAVTEFQAAMYSTSEGYTRTNFELARALIAMHRPQEAIDILRPALHGPLEASAYYVPRTELQDVLWQAYAAANQRDSAATYARKVANAWQHADPILRQRRERAYQFVAAPKNRPAHTGQR